MSFWENVEYVREFREMTRKELAYKADFSINSISTGITRGSLPAVDVACRIAKVLDVSVEFLVNGDMMDIDSPNAKSIPKSENQIFTDFSQRTKNLLKYIDFIEDYAEISPSMQKTVAELVHKINNMEIR